MPQHRGQTSTSLLAENGCGRSSDVPLTRPGQGRDRANSVGVDVQWSRRELRSREALSRGLDPSTPAAYRDSDQRSGAARRRAAQRCAGRTRGRPDRPHGHWRGSPRSTSKGGAARRGHGCRTVPSTSGETPPARRPRLDAPRSRSAFGVPWIDFLEVLRQRKGDPAPHTAALINLREASSTSSRNHSRTFSGTRLTEQGDYGVAF